MDTPGLRLSIIVVDKELEHFLLIVQPFLISLLRNAADFSDAWAVLPFALYHVSTCISKPF